MPDLQHEGPPVVEVSQLTVTYPRTGQTAPVGVDLRIAPGERVLLLGPSGSGKSTLLRVLAGVVPQNMDADVDGHVLVGGHDPRTTPVARLAGVVGTLGQDPASGVALPRVDDDVAFGLENACTPPELIGPGVIDALESVGAGHLAGRRTRELSGGELQRVALAAVLARRPQLLLLDEPTSMLDPAAAASVQTSTLVEPPSAQTAPPAVIVVDHQLEDVLDLPPRVVVLDGGGRVVADGPTAAVLAARAGELAAGGSWLPLAVEVSVATGLPLCGRLPDVRAALTQAAPRLRELASVPLPMADAGPVVLRAREAAFATGRGSNDAVLVSGVDLDLRAGTVTAVLGVNGSGKTSLLLGLAGLLARTRGTVDTDTGAGMVFQFPERQFLTRSVAAEIGYGLRGEPDAAERVQAALELFRLADHAEADPFRLSGGQQRRLSVASVTILNPGILLLDEPTFGQDRAHSLEVADALRAMADDEHCAVVIATHDIRLAGLVADRVLVMSEGRVVHDGVTDVVLGDHALLSSAGLARPVLLDWWAEQPGLPLRGLLAGLRSAVGAQTVAAS